MDCQDVNWAKWANIMGKVAVVSLFFFAIITWVVGNSPGIGVYAFFLAILIAPLEFPQQFGSRSETCDRVIHILLEDWHIKNGFLRAVIYVLLSIVCFLNETASIGGGVFLLLAAILYFAAQASGQHEDSSSYQKAGQGSSETEPPPGFGPPGAEAYGQPPAAAPYGHPTSQPAYDQSYGSI
eukprot:Rmarinus@m.9